MHLQYRIKLASGELTETPGAAPADLAESDPIDARPGSLARLARLIADAGINVRLVSGRGIETGGFLVLAVNDEHGPHAEHSHTGDAHGTAAQADDHGASRGAYQIGEPGDEPSDEAKLKALLDEHRYRYERVAPALAVLEDRIGALADWAASVASEGKLVDTIALATPEAHGEQGERIPLQATTIAVGAPVAPQPSREMAGSRAT